VVSEFEAVGRGHAHVQKDSVEFLIGEATGGFGAAGEGVCFETSGAQEFGNELTRSSIIVYDEDLGTRPIRFSRHTKLPRARRR
jgi:hypothetical protein